MTSGRFIVALAAMTKYIDSIEQCFLPNVEVAYYLDNDVTKQSVGYKHKNVYHPRVAPLSDLDYVIVTLSDSTRMVSQLINCGIDESKLILFFEMDLGSEVVNSLFDIEKAMRFRYDHVLLNYQKTINETLKRIDRLERAFDNHIYEDEFFKQENAIVFPKILSISDTIDKILSENVSISRFGDGEFDIMLGESRSVFQSDNDRLASRLKEIVISNLDNHIVALADDYGVMKSRNNLNKYVTRRYMTPEKREKHYKLIDMEKTYYDAYVTRPYVIYDVPPDEVELRFDKWKKVWQDRDILLIEGELTRMGVNNDLFADANSVIRLLAPTENAFEVYDKLLEASLLYSKDRITLISLGQTATVLAYDLAQAGRWAIDIGHLDIEYEWFIRRKPYCDIPYKYNNEVFGGRFVLPIDDYNYMNSIVAKVMP